MALHLVDLQHTADALSLEQAFRDEIMNHHVSWTCCQRTLGELRITFMQEEEGWTRISRNEAIATIDRLCKAEALYFLDSEQLPSLRPSNTLEQMEHDCFHTDLNVPTERDWIPRPCGWHQIMLHAFSGRRRPGDLQLYLEQLFDRAGEGVHLTAVSLDIVTDRVMGDVTSWETQAFWFFHASCGDVAGFLAGPPCETWSKARFAPVAISSTPGRRIHVQ